MTTSLKHLAIIMDGNGRWAEEHALPRIEGHRRGADTVERIVTAARDRGISYLTLYAFSEENWQRPDDEIVALMELLAEYLSFKRSKLMAQNVRFCAIGDVSRLPERARKEIADTMAATAACTAMTLCLALSYGSQQEICRAVNTLHASGIYEVTPQMLSQALDTRDFPDPDLLIRTSGEYRISNFLLWQLAYAELYFTETLWPDFDEAALDEALAEFSRRERRFGRTSAQLRASRKAAS